jgi:hypothetical protein
LRGGLGSSQVAGDLLVARVAIVAITLGTMPRATGKQQTQ